MEYVILLISVAFNFFFAKTRNMRSVRWALLGVFPIIGNVVLLIVANNRKPQTYVNSSASNENQTLTGRKSIGKSVVSDSKIYVAPTGSFRQQVVGENNYGSTIRSLVGSRSEEVFMEATLIREATNKFDRNAVRVDVNNKTVGYIPREEARSFHNLLDFASQRKSVVVVQSRIWWGGSYGSVSLDIGDPDVAVAVNGDDLQDGDKCWPIGGKVQVVKEDQFVASIDEIKKLSYSDKGCSVFLEVRCSLNESSKQLVEIYFRNKKVGELSAQMTKKFWDGFNLRSSQEKLYVMGSLKGNSLTTEIVLSLKSPEELGEQEVKFLSN